MRLYNVCAHDEDGNVVREWPRVAAYQISMSVVAILRSLEDGQYITVVVCGGDAAIEAHDRAEYEKDKQK